MSKPQRVLLTVVLAVVALFCIVPPWYNQFQGSISTRGYGPLWAPPLGSSHIDLGRLVVQAVVAVVLGAAFNFLIRGKQPESRGEVLKTVCAQEFRVVDKSGTARAALRMTECGQLLLGLNDQNGNNRGGLFLDESGQPALILLDQNGKTIWEAP